VLSLATQHKNIYIERGKEKGKGRRKGGEGWNPFTFPSE
jgi:hypothetical protein